MIKYIQRIGKRSSNYGKESCWYCAERVYEGFKISIQSTCIEFAVCDNCLQQARRYGIIPQFVDQQDLFPPHNA